MKEVKDKIESYRKAVYDDITVTKCVETPHGVVVHLRQQYLDFYYSKKLQEAIQSFEKHGVVEGFFADFYTYINVIKQNKKKLQNFEQPLQRRVTYQGITYDEYDKYVGLALRYPQSDEPLYRYGAVWFRDFELAKEVFNIDVGNTFPGHIKLVKFSQPIYPDQQPHPVTGIYYGSVWCSDYMYDLDKRDQKANVDPQLELVGEHKYTAASLVEMDSQMYIVDDAPEQEKQSQHE